MFNTGIKKDKVLPDPVHDPTMTSWFLQNNGMTAFYTGITFGNPASYNIDIISLSNTSN